MKNRHIARIVIACGLAMTALAASAVDSLYREDTYQPLTADRKGTRVGDLVTVQIFEASSATSTADTNSDRSADLAVEVAGTQRRLRRSASLSNDMQGTGRTERTGRLLAQVTVSIKEILPNGDLMLAGDQMLEINDERQRIHLEGRIRPVDLQENNLVLSSRLADAKISYLGNGVIGDKQKPAWWQKILTALGV
ncbi:flagellar basal body L-ring protein FlgH [Piscinibacter terrae]|uniref:Flagellar L-ring protein n=1 Tax=Piscinibacter terrae TaxID=2496871 RepID=A0A3N7HWF4_9BURK|nr:flagellar basal body L-ring protein FlgH [Albitalea terrae]RQP26657.1 flagellar basal body L-ring protein FlgH [Albitalea terrae]